MKKLLITAIALLSIECFSGQEGGGGPRTTFHTLEIDISEIQSIETISRSIIYDKNLLNKFRINDGSFLDSTNILNIELTTGQIIDLDFEMVPGTGGGEI